MRKGAVRFDSVETHPEPGEIWRVLDRVLGPQNKTLNEANPVVYAKLPATEHNPGGGRIKALHPVIVPPGKDAIHQHPPVRAKTGPAGMADRAPGALNAEMMDDLREAMQSGKRILICGGTRTGKTTMLSALCNFLPEGWRIVKIEDPEEIWIDRNVVTLEARPSPPGSSVPEYSARHGVDDAMRMSPDYLIIGEVRDGRAAMSLFRALMTGHSGCCTLHAESPRETADRLAGLMGTDMGINRADALRTVASAIDIQVQIGIRHDKRRVISISQVEKELKNGTVWFNRSGAMTKLFRRRSPRWNKTGEWKQRTGAG